MFSHIMIGTNDLDKAKTFYDGCANAIWEHEGLLNKTIGDAVMAVFNFPTGGARPKRRACGPRHPEELA